MVLPSLLDGRSWTIEEVISLLDEPYPVLPDEYRMVYSKT